MKVRFIINPAAGGSCGVYRITDAVKKTLQDEEGIFEIKSASGKESVSELSLEAVRRDYEVVFACGGDGTINEAASHLVGTGTVLGVVPCGSGNGFARSLGIPEDPEAAISLVKSWNVKEVDVGVIGNRYFFSTAGCGFDARLSKRYDSGALAKRIRGIFPYFPLALCEFFKYRHEPVVITAGGRELKVTPFILTVANTAYYGGSAAIAPGADPADGLLDLCVIPNVSFVKTPDLAFKLLRGKIDAFKGYERIRADSIEITGRKNRELHADGEPFERDGDIIIKVLPRKLKVLVK